MTRIARKVSQRAATTTGKDTFMTRPIAAAAAALAPSAALADPAPAAAPGPAKAFGATKLFADSQLIIRDRITVEVFDQPAAFDAALDAFLKT